MSSPPWNAKHFATVQARCALRGAVLEQLEADDGSPELVLTCNAATLRLQGADALAKVEAWLDDNVRGFAA